MCISHLIKGKVGITVSGTNADRIANNVYQAFQVANNDVLTADDLNAHLTTDYPKVLAVLGHMHKLDLVDCRATGNGVVWWLQPEITNRVTQR